MTRIKPPAAPPQFESISPTAMLIACFRRFTDLPFADQIATEIGAEQAALRLLGDRELLAATTRANAPFSEARFKCIDSALGRSGLNQVLELGCGLSFRGLSSSPDSGGIYVLTDLPGVVADVTRVLAGLADLRAAAERANVFIEAANALSLEQIEPCLRRFDPPRRVGVVHEGFLPYLDFEEKATVARCIRRVLERFGGAWITPDLPTRASLAQSDRNDPATAKAHAAVAQSTSRDFSVNAFDDDDHIDRFFGELGFAVRSHPQLDGSFEIASLARLDLPADYLLSSAAHLRCWTLTLR